MYFCQIRETSASSGFENIERTCLKSEAYNRFFYNYVSQSSVWQMKVIKQLILFRQPASLSWHVNDRYIPVNMSEKANARIIKLYEFFNIVRLRRITTQTRAFPNNAMEAITAKVTLKAVHERSILLLLNTEGSVSLLLNEEFVKDFMA